MSATWVIEGLALALLLALSAFFAGAETALFSLDSLRLHRIAASRPKVARLIEGLLAKPERPLSTILIGTTLVNVAASSLGYVMAERLFPSHGEGLSILAMTLLLVLFGEVTPKRLAMAHGTAAAIYCAPALAAVVYVITPLRYALEQLAGLFRTHLTKRKRALTEDEFMTVLDVGEEEGVLKQEERSMLDGIIRLRGLQASGAMTPRVDLIGIDLDDPPEKQRQVVETVHFRYLPVYRGSLDYPEGFLDVSRYLLSKEHALQEATIPPFAVPETAPLDKLLAAFQKEGRRVAIVVDEYGGTAGLLSRGDILEEIVPDASDEHEEKPAIEQVGENRWLIDGGAGLEQVNYALGIRLAAEGVDRMAGWVSAQAERIVRMGERVEAQGVRVTVQRTRRHRITMVLLEKLPSAGPEVPA